MKQFRAPPAVERIFSEKVISEAITRDRLLTLSLSLPVGCNIRCAYCWVFHEHARGREDLSFEEIVDVIDQAAALGVKTISIVGKGEPLKYRKLLKLVELINEKKMKTIVFTNNMLINEKTADFLFKHHVLMVVKLNSLNLKVQESLTGKGSWAKMQRGLMMLMKKGFNKKSPTQLAIHSVIIRQNYKGLIDLWRFCRSHNIIPYLHTLIPSANMISRKRELEVSKFDLRTLYGKLLKIDRAEFNYTWHPDYTYPIPAMGCCVVKAGCAVGANGDVGMCGYVSEALGNVRDKSLRKIIMSGYVRKIRRFKYKPENYAPHFYGCRAVAFNTTGDRFAEDSFFWKNGIKL